MRIKLVRAVPPTHPLLKNEGGRSKNIGVDILDDEAMKTQNGHWRNSLPTLQGLWKKVGWQ